MHPRISLHQVGFLDRDNAAFVDACRRIGVPAVTLVTPALAAPGAVDDMAAMLASGAPRCATLNHAFAAGSDLEQDDGRATAGLLDAIAAAARLGADALYLLSGARGALDWEQAADRFAALVAPCLPVAEAKGVRLLVENANAFNADIHIAHTLADATRLAATAGIGLCLDLHACWHEGGLTAAFRRALPITGLVQISDYVLGDRSTPCRAVPGDGAIPLDRRIGDLLDMGYSGLFDLELVGPRIAAEGAEPASARAADWLSGVLVRLGA